MLAEAQRRELLAAMGIDLYVLRTDAAGASVRGAEQDSLDVIVFCAQDPGSDRDARNLHRVLPQALGVAGDRVSWLRGGSSRQLPPARACLMMDEVMAREFDAGNGPALAPTTLVATVAEPSRSMRDAQARRALWQALKPLRRHLRAGDG